MKKLLVIDNDPPSRELIKAIFTPLQIQVLTASNGADGIALAHEFMPEMILMDLRLPGAKGHEIARQIKDDPLLHHIPIILVTATLVDIKDMEMLRPFSAYLAKPFLAGELRKLVTEYAAP